MQHLSLLLIFLLPSCGSRSLLTADASSSADGSSCTMTGYRLTQTRYLEGGELTFMESGALVAAGGQVYYGARATTGSNSGEDLDLFAANAATGKTEQLTQDELETIMLDARGGSVLYAERSRGGSHDLPWRLILRRGPTSSIDLGTHQLRFAAHGDLYAEPARQLLDGVGAAWATDSQVFHYDGSSVSAVAATKFATPPFLADGAIVFSASDGKDHEIYRYREGKLEQLTDNETSDRGPVLVGDEVLWLCDGKICRLRGAESDVLEPGECEVPSAAGASAAWGCLGHLSRYTPGRPLAKIDRSQALAAGVRIDGAFLAWVEPDGNHPYDGQGTLYVSDGTRTLDVARVGLPCVYCSAYWPPLQISLRGELLAWSYARPSTPQHGAHSYGYLRVISETTCR